MEPNFGTQVCPLCLETESWCMGATLTEKNEIWLTNLSVKVQSTVRTRAVLTDGVVGRPQPHPGRKADSSPTCTEQHEEEEFGDHGKHTARFGVCYTGHVRCCQALFALGIELTNQYTEAQAKEDKQTQVPATVPGNHGTAAGGDQVGPATLPNPVTPEVDPVIPQMRSMTGGRPGNPLQPGHT